ncbi:S-layer homology domain-containing protein [Pelosinus sp. sgz500959]|uniref:S-layer homology domain-containing protein n=1 Tax=Pelosinus sp. sgz500959 TaxID=3242472 RepID=UPI00366EBA83
MKMNQRMLKVAVVSALTVAFTVPAFANPFTDVPVKHWSYDAVSKLAQAGVIDGYSDGTFKGDKTVTRYEMAQIVAKAMTKSLNADQKAMVDQLSKEFATELNTMGVKVEGLQNQIDNMVKISGDARVRYTDAGDVFGDKSDLRARVAFDGKINDDLKFNARLSGSFDPNSTNNNDVVAKLDTANVTFNALGLTNTVGRQDVKLGSGVLFDDTLNGLATQAGALKIYAGKTTGGVTPTVATGTGTANVAERMYGVEYGGNLLGAAVTADYMKQGDYKAYAINGSAPLTRNVTANADYVKNDTNNAAATAFGVKFNNLGLSVTHRDADAGVYNAYSSSDVLALPTDVAIKGMEYQYDRNLGKNAALNVKYQDFDNMDTRTSAAVNVKF